MTQSLKLIFLLLATYIAVSQNIASNSSFACSNAPQWNCGVSGQCFYYTWLNGTCVSPTSCPTTPILTVWSNSTFNCVQCPKASQSVCGLCTGYFYDIKLKTCTTCEPRYGASCLKCDNSGCNQCITGLILSSDKQYCQNTTCNIAYCDICSNATACKTCDSSHYVRQGICICIILNCEVCANSYCSKCLNGYALDQSRQICNKVCITNCINCTDLSSCSTCIGGYYYDQKSNTCQPNCTILIHPNCISCSSGTVCEQCGTGYILAVNRTACVASCNDSNCISCLLNKSNCTQCKLGYRLNGVTCVSDVCQIKNCLTCATSSTCSICASDSQLSSDKTTCAPTCNITNCGTCQNSTRCGVCITGFQVSSAGKCVSICPTENCELCATLATCARCAVGYTLSSDFLTCSLTCQVFGCTWCNSSTTCAQCYPGYVLDNTARYCVNVCPRGKYSLNNTCVNCPDNALTCDTNGLPLACKDFYYLNTTSYSCIACSTTPNCFNCDASSGACIRCNSNFYLSGGQCLSAGSTCTVANCKACKTGSSTSCLYCNFGYSINSASTCDKITCVGKQFYNGSVCTCGTKNYLYNGQCYSCTDSNCISCTSDTCYTCIQGYYPSVSSCIPCFTTNCQKCDSSGCNACSDGFLLNNGKCQAKASTKPMSVSRVGIIICPFGCATCDINKFENVVCNTASDGYVLWRGAIYQCDSSCVTCSSTIGPTNAFTNCLTCPSRYALVTSSCVKCNDSNAYTCSSYDVSVSLSCMPGFTLSNGTCSACAANCLKCDSQGAGSCDSKGCSTGYYNSQSFLSNCVKCFNGCLNCGSDPNICISCGNFKYLQNNTCYTCSSNCIACNNSDICTTCISGYLVAFDGTCKAPNVDGCVSYDSNITCTACDISYIFNNTTKTCTLSLSCNANSSCTICTSNYYLSASKCLPCGVISNCLSCNQNDATKCIICVDGYYLTINGTCVSCPQEGCLTCSSASVCTSAKNGYYLTVNIFGFSTGLVDQCDTSCSTCRLNAGTCLECASDYIKSGTHCKSRNYKAITFAGNMRGLVGGSYSQSYEVSYGNSYFARILYQIAMALRFKSFQHFMRNTNIKNLKYRSISSDLEVNSNQIGVSDPGSAIAATSFTDLNLLSVSVVDSSTSTSSVNLGLVLGIAIPLGVLLIAIIIILKVRTSEKEDTDGLQLDATQKPIDSNQPQNF